MADSWPVDVILEYLRKNNFSKAEAALRSELNKRPDLNGDFQKLTLDKEKAIREVNGVIVVEDRKTLNSRHNKESLKGASISSSSEASKELIVKEVDCGTVGSLSDSKWQSCGGATGEQAKISDSVGSHDQNFTFSKSSDDVIIDTYSWNYSPNSGPVASYQRDSAEHDFLGFQVERSWANSSENLDLDISCDKIISWPGSVGNAGRELKHERSEFKDVDQQRNLRRTCSKDELVDNSCLISSLSALPSSTSYDIAGSVVDKRERKKKDNDVTAATKDHVDEVGRTLYFEKNPGGEPKDFHVLDLQPATQNRKEELPRLPPVRLKSENKSLNVCWEEKFERDGPDPKILTVDTGYIIGSFLDVPFGQEINPSGTRIGGGNWLSVSQGIAEDTSGLVSDFVTIGDGLSESIDYPNEYWDSDEYEDDNDVGYTRQPIDDETWFLAREIDYPSDNEKSKGHGSVLDRPQVSGQNKIDEDDQSFAEINSYFYGERYFQSKNVNTGESSDDPIGLSASDLIDRYDGQLMDEEEFDLMRSEPAWQGFVSQTNELVMLEERKVTNQHGGLYLDDIYMNDDRHAGSVRSIGVGINSDVRDHDVNNGGHRHLHRENDKITGERLEKDKNRTKKHDSDKYVTNDKGSYTLPTNHIDGGFSFPPPRDMPLLVQMSSSKSTRNNGVVSDEYATFLEKSADSSPSSLSNNGYTEMGHVKTDQYLDASLEDDDEAAAVQEQVKQIKAQEEEFETFNLKIVHRKNRTGFEEDKSFHVVLNSVIAGRYHVTEYLGSAAFSKAIQAHDLHTGMDVCVKIIKNKKDFFDQSLDEIKLLKYVNKHDPADKYHILRLYDYFYYREHLLIVCELLKANLYEFHKFNRESGGEVYFTMPRLQSITVQCLEALQFLHSLGLIHCDLKPENILVKSYSRCEVRVIDLGSSCFESDNLCSYVQSRSYRAPEVILGLPYDRKIDIWSLGCILAELCSGNVLFQNDSSATLLARVIGIIGPIEQEMLAKGRDTHKYFTKSHMLYERNPETNTLEYLIPKRSSLRHRLPMGDQGFIDFVAHLLEVNPKKRPSAKEALNHPWLQYPYEPISS